MEILNFDSEAELHVEPQAFYVLFRSVDWRAAGQPQEERICISYERLPGVIAYLSECMNEHRQKVGA